ncbi:MAG: glycosyl hydrolase family 18 protein [Eubacteriales bacterium]
MNKKVILTLGILIGIILGILVGGSFVYLLFSSYGKQSSEYLVELEEVTDVSNDTEFVEEELGEEYSQQGGSEQGVIERYLESDCLPWTLEKIYVEGDLSQYEEVVYRAKWWTQGEVPNQSEVWERTTIQIEDLITIEEVLQQQSQEVVNTTPYSEEDFKVVAYYPSWKIAGLEKLDFSVITHVIYSFAIPTSEGDLLPLENPELARFIIEDAHRNQRKVLLAVGGWSYEEIPLEATFMEATNAPEKITKLGDAIVAMCNEYGFDGVDMDWEHPRLDGVSAQRYEALMVYLSEELQKHDKLLTSAVISGVTAQGQIYYDAAAHTDKVLEVVDWIHVMAYDGGDGMSHSAYEFTLDCGIYWNQTRGLESKKVVLGVPFYARPSWATYEEILETDPLAYSYDVSKYQGMDAYYNGVDTIIKKTEYAIEELGGIMIWEITQDTMIQEYSLLQAIKSVVISN